MQNGINLAKLRIKNHLTLECLANILKVSLSSYKLYEIGTIPMSLEEINILSIYYNVSFDYLLGLSDKYEKNHFRKSIDYRYLQFCIRYLRRTSKSSQKDFAKAFNYSISSISRFERNGTKVKLDYLIKIADKFQISSDYLCGKSLKKEIQ